MIKLIVTDMDGTLLNDNKEIAIETYELLHELSSQGIKICIASGRALNNVINTYLHQKEDVIFVGDNGATLKFPNQDVDITYFDLATLQKTVDIARKNNLAISMNSLHYTFISKDTTSEYEEILKHYGITPKRVENLKMIDEEVLKITIWEPRGSKKYALHCFDELIEADIVVSGEVWLDIVPKGVTKAYAIEKIMKKYNIQKDEVIAFGDYNNDIAMLKLAKYGIAMKNAVKPLKEIAYKVSDYTNNENGVYKELYEIFKK